MNFNDGNVKNAFGAGSLTRQKSIKLKGRLITKQIPSWPYCQYHEGVYPQSDGSMRPGR